MGVVDDLNTRLEFLGFTEDDREALLRARPLFEKYADGFVAAFYRHLLSFEPTRALLSDPQVKERLIHLQRDSLLSLTTSETSSRASSIDRASRR